MILKKSLALVILFYFNFIRALPPVSEEDLLEYINDVLNDRNNFSNYTDRKNIQNICTVPTEMCAAICQKILMYLRDFPEYKNFLYLNYNAFKSITEENKCTKIQVEVDPGFLSNNNQLIKQHGLVCYARESVDEEYAQSPDTYPFYKKIVIYPSNLTSIRIFEQVSNNNTYKFIIKMNNISWTRIKKIPSILHDVLIPRSVHLTNDYLQALISTEPENNPSKKQNSFSILYRMQHMLLLHICTIAYARPRYSNYFWIDKDKFQKQRGYKRNVKLSFQESSWKFNANICFGYTIDHEGNEQPTQEYLFIQGLNSHEIILLRNINSSKEKIEAEPMELIADFSKSYVNLMFYGFNVTNNLFQ